MKDTYKQKYMEKLKAKCMKRFTRYIISKRKLIRHNNIIQNSFKAKKHY